MAPKRRFRNIEKYSAKIFCKHFSSLLAQIELVKCLQNVLAEYVSTFQNLRLGGGMKLIVLFKVSFRRKMVRKRFLLTGQDALINTSIEHRFGNTLTSVIEVNKSISHECMCRTLTKRIGCVLRNPSHYLRARLDLPDMRYFYYTSEDAHRLTKRIIRRSNRRLTHFELGEMLVQSEMSAIICTYQNTFSIAVTHLFVDGVHLSELIGLCLDHPIIDWSVIPTFRYTPVFQEVALLPGLIGMMSSLSRRCLSVDSDWKRERHFIQQKQYTNRLDSIKRLKEYLNTRHQPSLGYSAVLAVISALYALENSTKDSGKEALNVGLVAGFQNETHFNNFSAILIPMRRPREWQAASILDKVHAVAAQVHRAITSHGKTSALISYLVTNVYNVNFYTNDLVDVLCHAHRHRDGPCFMVEMRG